MLLNQFRGKSNRCGKKALGSFGFGRIRRFSAGSECETLCRLVVRGVNVAMWAARAAGLGAGAQRLVDDGFDSARAPAAFGAAAEATINLLWIARQVRSRADGIPDIVVAKDVAGTNDHKNGRPIGDAWHLRY
jgi:hypothetical protein